MRFLPSVPDGEDKPFLPFIPSQIPTGNYIENDALVPYESPQKMELLPQYAANFRFLIEGKLPFIIAPLGSIQKPRVNAQLAVLLNHLNNIQAWDDMLIQVHALPGLGGQLAKLYLIDRHNRRYLVLNVELDPGRETGTLLLRPIGRRGRGGQKMRLDPEGLVDYSTNPPTPFGLPLILYKSGITRRRNPDEDIRKLERRASQGDSEAVKALAHARFRAGQMIESLEEFANLLSQIDVYEALTVNSYITALYEEEWFLNIAQMMFTEIAKELATEQRWTIGPQPISDALRMSGAHTINEVKVKIDSDYDKNGKFYEIEVEIEFLAPSRDEVDEREGMFQDHFIDWSDERRRDYEVEIEHDNWNAEIDRTEPNEGEFDDRLRELFDDQDLDEDDIEEMDGPDVPQIAKIELTQRLGLHHIFAIMAYNGMEVEELDLIPPSKPCPFCHPHDEDHPHCSECGATGMLMPNSNRKGYCAGSDWAVQIL